MEEKNILTVTSPFFIQHWYPITFDYDGKKLDDQRLFPWQKTAESIWG